MSPVAGSNSYLLRHPLGVSTIASTAVKSPPIVTPFCWGTGPFQLVDQPPEQGDLMLNVFAELERLGSMLLDLLVVQRLLKELAQERAFLLAERDGSFGHCR